MCTGILFVPLPNPTPGGRLYKKQFILIPMPEEIRRVCSEEYGDWAKHFGF